MYICVLRVALAGSDFQIGGPVVMFYCVKVVHFLVLWDRSVKGFNDKRMDTARSSLAVDAKLEPQIAVLIHLRTEFVMSVPTS